MTEAPNYNGVAHEMRQACEQDLNIPATIDNLPVEIQVMILNGLTTAPDLLALRATSRTWRLLMSGDRGPVLALCRTLLSDEAVNRLATHPHADVLACIVYGILKTAGASLRSIEPIDQYCTTYWVPRVMGTFCGWGLSLSKVRVYGAASLCTWSVGRWSDGKLVDGMTRAPHMVPEVPGCRWRPHVLPAGSPCARCRMRRTMWTGRVVGGVAHGHGVWKISRCQECRTNGAAYARYDARDAGPKARSYAAPWRGAAIVSTTASSRTTSSMDSARSMRTTTEPARATWATGQWDGPTATGHWSMSASTTTIPTRCLGTMSATGTTGCRLAQAQKSGQTAATILASGTMDDLTDEDRSSVSTAAGTTASGTGARVTVKATSLDPTDACNAVATGYTIRCRRAWPFGMRWRRATKGRLRAAP